MLLHSLLPKTSSSLTEGNILFSLFDKSDEERGSQLPRSSWPLKKKKKSQVFCAFFPLTWLKCVCVCVCVCMCASRLWSVFSDGGSWSVRLSAAAFLNSHFHSLHVSNEVHWDSNLVTLVPAAPLRSSPPSLLRLCISIHTWTWHVRPHTHKHTHKHTHTHTGVSRYQSDSSTLCARCHFARVILRSCTDQAPSLLISCPLVFIPSSSPPLLLSLHLHPLHPPSRSPSSSSASRNTVLAAAGACKWSFVSALCAGTHTERPGVTPTVGV